MAALLAVGLAAPLASAAPAAADHTLPTVVTLVGSLQQELGCPGDWQPECTASALRPVEGSPGTWAATFELPAGDYEYEVAVGGSWDEDCGAAGAAGGGNIPVTATGGSVTFSYDEATHVIGDDVPDPVGGATAAHRTRSRWG